VDVVGFAVELDADGAHGVFAEGEHLAGEHLTPVFGHEH
jgi:hypothetical protein